MDYGLWHIRQYGIYGYPHIRHIYDNIDPSITLTQFPDSIQASPWQQPSAYFFIESHHEFTPMFNDLTAADHAYITPRRIDSASALSRSVVGRHLMVGRGRRFTERSAGIEQGKGQLSHPNSEKWNRSIRTCAQDNQITRTMNNMINRWNVSIK
jgi:hypothetical protein